MAMGMSETVFVKLAFSTIVGYAYLGCRRSCRVPKNLLHPFVHSQACNLAVSYCSVDSTKNVKLPTSAFNRAKRRLFPFAIAVWELGIPSAIVSK